MLRPMRQMRAQPAWETGQEMEVIPAILLFCCVTAVSTGQYKPIQVEIPSKNSKVFTAEEIAQYDGTDPNKPLYMAVKGIVFDVSTGADFYGKGAAYNALTGRDCTRAVAKMSLDPEDLTHDISGLSDDHLKSLDQVYEGTYRAKYPVVGIMDYLAADNLVHEHGNPLFEDGLHDHHKDDL